MHKRLKRLIKITKEIFSISYLDKVSRKVKFVQRKSKISAETFLAFNIFSSHDIYSLRWQIELMFKIWKSTFNIYKVKKVKMERFKCFLYGRLIALLLTSSIVFTASNIIYEEERKEISKMKSFDEVVEYFPLLRVEIFKGELCIIRLLNRILTTIKKLGIKSKKKGKKTVNIIINFMKIRVNELKIMTV